MRGNTKRILIALAAALSVGHADAATFYMRVRGEPTPPAPAPLCAVSTVGTVPTGRVGASLGLGFRVTQPNNAPLGYSVQGALPPGVTFDERRPALVGTPTVEGQYGPIRVVVDERAGVPGSYCSSDPITLTVLPKPPSVGAAVAAGRAYSPYEMALTTDGQAPSTWAIAPALPEGLVPDPSAPAIRGTPRQAGTFGPFVASSTDARGLTGSSSPFTIGVAEASLTMTSLLSATTAETGTPWSASFEAGGGSGSYTYVIDRALPAGLTFDAASGTVGGIPSEVGDFGTFLVTASDANCAATVSAGVAVNVVQGANPATLYLEDAQIPTVVQDRSWSYDFTAHAVVQNVPKSELRWSASGLPAGLYMSYVTGKVSGTPTASFSGKVKVTASYGGISDIHEYDLTIESDEFPALQMATGGNHNCAIATDRTVWCWGDGFYGQLGDGLKRDSSKPVKVFGLSGIQQISSSADTTCAVSSGGTLSCWGKIFGGTSSNATPVTVAGQVDSVAVGASHACLVTWTGAAKCWGGGSQGQIGDSGTSSRTSPSQVSGFSSGVKQVAVGGLHSCLVTDRGAAHCWGSGLNGRLGDGLNKDSKTPVLVTGMNASTQSIAAGDFHACVIKVGGSVYCWGDGGNGRLGDNTYLTRSTPVLAKNLSGASKITGGSFPTCATNSSGAYCWGNNSQGMLGNGSSSGSVGQPTRVPGISDVSDISAGAAGSCAVADGIAYCWGHGRDGLTGDGGTSGRSSPTKVSSDG